MMMFKKHQLILIFSKVGIEINVLSKIASSPTKC